MESILALDPGKTTGYCLYESNTYKIGHLTEDEIWKFVGLWHLTLVEPGTLIVERFQFRQLPKVELAPVEVIGVVKEWARQHQQEIIWQTPSQAKTFFTDQQLKERGLYQKNMKHGLDALRHVLYYQKAFVK